MKVSFKRNMSNLDRAFRAIIGLTLLTLGPVSGFITTDGLSTLILGIIGTIAVTSALFSYCLLYEVTGFCTLKNT